MLSLPASERAKVTPQTKCDEIRDIIKKYNESKKGVKGIEAKSDKAENAEMLYNKNVINYTNVITDEEKSDLEFDESDKAESSDALYNKSVINYTNVISDYNNTVGNSENSDSVINSDEVVVSMSVKSLDFLFRKGLHIVSALSDEFLSVGDSIVFRERFYEAFNTEYQFLLNK
jgi:hypothetical protein